MNEYKVEKDIPIPTIQRFPPHRPSKYPWADLEIGDSFAIPTDGLNQKSKEKSGYDAQN